MVCVYFMSGAPEGSTNIGFAVARDRICGPWFTRPVVYPLQQLVHLQLYKKKPFCGFFMGSNQYRAGRVSWFVCVLYDGSTRRLNRKRFWRSWESNLRPLVYKA